MASPTQITEETILQRYESLPQDLKDAMIGIGTADVIYDIGKRAGLNVEQIGDLAQEIGMIILGLTPSTNFISDIKRTLNIDEEKAASMARDVNDKVFLRIRESLKRMHGASFGDGLTKEPMSIKPPAPPTAKPVSPSPLPAVPLNVPAPTITPRPAPQPLTPSATPTQKITPPTQYIPPAPAKPYTPAASKPIAPFKEPTPVKKEPLVIHPMGTGGIPHAPSMPGATLPLRPPLPEQQKSVPPMPLIIPPVEKTTTPSTSETKPAPPVLPPPPPRLPVMEEKIESAVKLPPTTLMPSPEKPLPPEPKTPNTDPYREPVE